MPMAYWMVYAQSFAVHTTPALLHTSFHMATSKHDASAPVRDGRFLTATQLQNLRYYKYCGVDRSYLTKYVLNPFWNWLVSQVPTSIAPNLITLTGLLFMISATFLVFFYNDNPPRWLYFYISFCISTYLNLDAIDGKQARRTGTSSPLGELFDHGCDAVNMLLMTILIPFISGIPFGPSHVLIALFGFAGFLGSTWEEWHTGILYLGIVSGPTEGAWSLCLISLITGIYGSTEIWTVAREVPFLNISLPLSNVVLYTFLFGVLSTIRTSCLHVWRKSGFKALSHLLWPFFYFCQCWLLTRFSSEIMASKSEFYWFVFFAGLPTCLRVSLTIVAYVTKSSLPSPSPLEFLPAVLIVLASYGFEVSALMKAMTMVSLLAYSVAINLVVGDLCRFLDIYCLTIKRK